MLKNESNPQCPQQLGCWEKVGRFLCSVLHPNTEHGDCLREIVDVTAARAQRKWRTAYNR